MQISAVYDAVLHACDDTDAKLGLKVPVVGPFFARVVMRNHRSTSKRLRRRQRAKLERERSLAAAKLASVEGALAAMGPADADAEDEDDPAYWRERRDQAKRASGVAEAPVPASFV